MEKEFVLVSISKDELQQLVKSAVRSELNKKAEKQLLNFKETCELLNIHPSTLNSWKSQGKIPYKKLNKRIFFSKSEVLAALKDSNHSKLRELT
jgi:predicted DNA-binding transcriptional regulator AlpA